MLRAVVLVASVLVLVAPQVVLGSCDYLANDLEGSQVIPPTSVTWTGWAQAIVCDGYKLLFAVHVWGSETVTALHVHGPASTTENGPILFDFGRPPSVAFHTILRARVTLHSCTPIENAS